MEYGQATSPTFGFYSAGLSDITLHIQKDGCISEITYPSLIEIHDVKSDFLITQLNYCNPFTVDLTDQSVNVSNWAWTMDGVAANDTTKFSHTFTADSTIITLAVMEEHGCRDSTAKVFKPELLEAQFNYSDSVGCTPFTVEFFNQGQNGSSWSWDFGDGNTSTLQNPTHTYTTTGTFDVTLVVQDSGVCADTLHISNLIQSSPPVIADYSHYANVSCTPMVVNFTDLSNRASTWAWDFGDGSTSILQHPLHIYNVAGSYAVSLAVTDSLGCSDTLNLSNLFSVPGPVAIFKMSGTTGCDSATIKFTDFSSNASNWYWTFGDGYSSNQQHPTHTYASSGSHMAMLTTHDSDGCTSVFTSAAPITVEPTPVAAFSISDSVGCDSTTVKFTSTPSVNNTLSYYWLFGQNVAAAGPTPEITFGPGTYDVQLIVTTPNGCSDTSTVTSGVHLVDSVSPQTELIRISVLSNSSVIVEWETGNTLGIEYYTLYRKDNQTGNFEIVEVITDIHMTSYTDYSLNTLDESYCYKIIASDVCGQSNDLDQASQHCTVNIT
ncbi:MAG: PKD domain-containing protein, partial [Bacteroidetes bacterium]|nr:PKD domain-containing protein [Bacteroidota bacterium]